MWIIIPGRFRSSSNSIKYYLIPDWYLSLYFFPLFAVYLYFELNNFIVLKTGLEFLKIGGSESNYFIIKRDQEPAEFLMAAGILLLIIICSYKQDNSIVNQVRKGLGSNT